MGAGDYQTQKDAALAAIRAIVRDVMAQALEEWREGEAIAMTPMTPEQRSAATRKAWLSRKRKSGNDKPTEQESAAGPPGTNEKREARKARDRSLEDFAAVIDDSPAKSEIVTIIKRAKITAQHLDGITRLSFPGIEDEMRGASGDFDPATGNIRIKLWMALDKEVVLHEIGHSVHLAKLTDSASAEWGTISKNGETAKISAYARKNAGEHFAEAFYAYSGGGQGRRMLKAYEPKAFGFMESLLGADGGKKLRPMGNRTNQVGMWRRYDANIRIED